MEFKVEDDVLRIFQDDTQRDFAYDDSLMEDLDVEFSRILNLDTIPSFASMAAYNSPVTAFRNSSVINQVGTTYGNDPFMNQPGTTYGNGSVMNQMGIAINQVDENFAGMGIQSFDNGVPMDYFNGQQQSPGASATFEFAPNSNLIMEEVMTDTNCTTDWQQQVGPESTECYQFQDDPLYTLPLAEQYKEDQVYGGNAANYYHESPTNSGYTEQSHEESASRQVNIESGDSEQATLVFSFLEECTRQLNIMVGAPLPSGKCPPTTSCIRKIEGIYDEVQKEKQKYIDKSLENEPRPNTVDDEIVGI